jgi:hypothetical protein
MRLKHLAWMLQANVYPLVVEHTPEEPRLAAARRDHVLKSLEELGFAVPEEWVIVGEPRAAGLSGEEALTVHQRMLPQQGRQPSPSTGGGTLTRGASTMLQESSAGPHSKSTTTSKAAEHPFHDRHVAAPEKGAFATQNPPPPNHDRASSFLLCPNLPCTSGRLFARLQATRHGAKRLPSPAILLALEAVFFQAQARAARTGDCPAENRCSNGHGPLL